MRTTSAAIIALGLSELAVTVAPSIASASSVGESYNAVTSDSENLGSYHIGGDALGLAQLDVDVAAKAFSKVGLVDGYLTVTDSTGQSSIRDFWIDVKQ